MAAIEALKSEDEAIIKAFYFRTLDLTAALMENDRLKQERERVLKAATPHVEIKAKESEPIDGGAPLDYSFSSHKSNLCEAV